MNNDESAESGGTWAPATYVQARQQPVPSGAPAAHGSGLAAAADGAALLSASLDAVQRRIQSGEIRLLRDESGLVRVSASVTFGASGDEAGLVPDAECIARMLGEIRLLQDHLAASRRNEARLQDDLDAAEQALSYTRAEVASLWRAMTSRSMNDATMAAARQRRDSMRVYTQSEHRRRIRAKLDDVRALARRRRFPWSLAGQ